ncbi:proline-rich protein HaeIII subfamily 1-like [Amphibalanus amphitrite]|uniref:proline-rich protein HaeIII subfamily 1-like n=1 Tax=Amphibalanus amphitrite TaxID=1232801 RepID=UPI001C918302|nr:proline-rich protein HaeIII subfamily 1-like [Amphibalanus amphitrite]
MELRGSRLTLVLLLVSIVCCERVPEPADTGGARRETRHAPLPPWRRPHPPPPPPPPRPGQRGLQPRPEETAALHPRHPLRLYSHRDGPHVHPAPRPGPPHGQDFQLGPPHGLDFQLGPPKGPDFRPGPPKGQDFQPGPPHGPDFQLVPPKGQDFRPGPPHDGPDFRPGPPSRPEFGPGPPLSSDIRPERPHYEKFRSEPPHGQEPGPSLQQQDEFSFGFGDSSLSQQQRDEYPGSPQPDFHSEPKSGCRINGKMYAPGQSWHLANCRRGTCVKFGHNYYVSEDRCSVKYHNANYACVIYQDKDRPYPDCCPYYRCNPEN